MANTKTTLIEEAHLQTSTTKFFTDLEAIRLSPEDKADVSAREIVARIPVRRPKRGEFVRCHPDPVMTVGVSHVDDDDGEATTLRVPSPMSPAAHNPHFHRRKLVNGDAQLSGSKKCQHPRDRRSRHQLEIRLRAAPAWPQKRAVELAFNGERFRYGQPDTSSDRPEQSHKSV
jgi:hypothetical protein